MNMLITGKAEEQKNVQISVKIMEGSSKNFQ